MNTRYYFLVTLTVNFCVDLFFFLYNLVFRLEEMVAYAILNMTKRGRL